jgi:sarcosine oxidase
MADDAAMAASYDTIVVGLGAMGSCALEALARRGRRVLGIDRFSPPHERGSSHGGSRVIRLSYFEHSDYVPLLRHAYEGFDRLGRDAGERLRHQTGLVAGGAPGNIVAAGMLRSAREHELDVEAIDGRELVRRFPQFTVPANWELVTETRGGFVRPEATIRAALGLAKKRGAVIECDCPVKRWGADARGAWVETDRARHDAATLVLCGGAWMRELLGDVGRPLQPTRETIVWLDDAGDPGWCDAAMPVWLFDRGELPAVYGVPAFENMGDPRGMKIGLHGAGPKVRPEQIGEPPSEAIIADTVSAAAERIPAARERRVVSSKHCLYTMTPDSDFMVGLHPAHANVVIAGGFSGHGFKFAPVIGAALSDLATTGATALPIGFLSTRRFG